MNIHNHKLLQRLSHKAINKLWKIFSVEHSVEIFYLNDYTDNGSRKLERIVKYTIMSEY